MTRNQKKPADPSRRDDDDGRTVADMSGIEAPSSARFADFWRRRPKRGAQPDAAHQNPPLTARETRNMMIQSVLAALAIGLVFLTAIFLFILFSLHIWLK
ncbi:MAG: hypothetical protein GX112_09755 [Clostridiaceae bacterium]|jgi:hypothetical protein|nr:hypothetical protein [Clostridiaceae bacterium]